MINVAIDGPAGAGKSTIAKKIAQDLGYMYIDTGAMYRTLAYKAIGLGLDIGTNHDAVCRMLADTSMDVVYKDGVQRMLCDGIDVTDYIRTPAVSSGASAISAIPEVRAWLLDFQRNLAKNNNCLMDGRDIGTVVLPFANVKIFLTASPEARAKRRYDELVVKGESVTLKSVLSDMIVRDRNDSTRACAPLKQAEDAVLVDTSDLSFDESVDAIKAIIADKVGDN
ncbi:MAG: (d)CMP kinase [Clostridia bacterium]|nr:(d)CMP kinase [Clostridia bacterium]